VVVLCFAWALYLSSRHPKADLPYAWTIPLLLYVAAPIGAAAITYLISRHMRTKRVAEIERRRAADEIRTREEEANRLAINAQRVLQESRQIVESMPAVLDNAEAWLRHAEDEFSAHAYSPFWDAIEEGTLNLARFAEMADQLSRNARTYDGVLRGRRHDFPPFPVQPSEIPDPRPAVGELRRLVRMGQTDFQFAQIWEDHKTRQVLALGFGTLAEAIEGIGESVSSHLDELRDLLREHG
jgi:hypothetical protein